MTARPVQPAEPSCHADPQRIAIVGVGLLGGSVAMSLRRRLGDARIIGVVRSEATAATAKTRGVIDEAFTTIQEGCRDCDAVVVCVPVDAIATQVHQIAEVTPPHCLITDVGSTKAQIVAEVRSSATSTSKFVAAHPIAGSEKTGVSHASATLLDDKTIVLTPTPQTPAYKLEQARRFWSLTGGRCVVMSPAEHDTHLAAVSHVPHLIAALLTHATPEDSLPLTGSGWRDITRVAAGDPEMWTAICHQNRDAITTHLQRLEASLAELRRLVATGPDDAITRWLRAAQAIRQR